MARFDKFAGARTQAGALHPQDSPEAAAYRNRNTHIGEQSFVVRPNIQFRGKLGFMPLAPTHVDAFARRTSEYKGVGSLDLQQQIRPRKGWEKR